VSANRDLPADREQACGRTATMAEYAAALAAEGVTVVPGSSGCYWVGNVCGSLFREPTSCLAPPQPGEVRRALWKARAPVATYILAPSDEHPANAWLYVCENQKYRLEDLGYAARRDIRRAMRQLRFEFIDAATLLARGAKAFCDTQKRLGLSDGTPEVFRRDHEPFGRNPAMQIAAAWAEGFLAAFATVQAVDAWADIGVYAADDHLSSCPVNGLIHFALNHYLVERKFRGVGYGLSSIQEASKAATLDRFKKKAGFEARPVHRAFVLHPLVRPLANRLTLCGLRLCTRLRPSSRRWRKATGLLATYLNRQAAPAHLQQDEND
jgi:hypothetical protein